MPYMSVGRTALFWGGIDKTGGEAACWPWTRSVDKHGYGKIKIGGTTYRTHRLAYFLVRGADPGDNFVCHTCDVPKCCNPAHHFLGDNAANQRDCVAKGRKPKQDQKGENNHSAKLGLAEVERIREMIRAGALNTQIARVFGVTHQMVSRIRRGKAWGAKEPMQPKYASLRK
jgi:hypothetical protein